MSAGQTIDLHDHTEPDATIRSKSFVDATILGPALLTFREGCGLWTSTFTNNFEETVITLDEGRSVAGVIALHDVTFMGCTFVRVTFLMTPRQAADLSQDVFRG